MLKKMLLSCCFIYLFSCQLLFCLDTYLEKDKKYIIYQTELDQLKSNLNSIEKEKNLISETLKLQTISFNKLTQNLINTELTLNQSEKKITQLENNLTTLSLKMKDQENIREYEVHVSAHPTDTGRVNIDLTMENIGHIERFRQIMNVGIMGAGDTTVV